MAWRCFHESAYEQPAVVGSSGVPAPFLTYAAPAPVGIAAPALVPRGRVYLPGVCNEPRWTNA